VSRRDVRGVLALTFLMATRSYPTYLRVMLHSIRTGPAAPAAEEPLELLLACHARLRHFSELSLVLATRQDLPREDAADASTRLVRYFRLALPLHEADEEKTVAPALLATPARALVEDALGAMTAQHAELHEVLASLLPAWEQLETGSGAELPGLPALSDARRLASLLDAHLALEEHTIFPNLSAVDPAARKRLLGEMRARRTPEVMAVMQKVVLR
jgi:hemerythrin-like domain-containing protein